MPRVPAQLVFISLTYLFYFGQLGILTPYLGIFLNGRGFSSADIGTLFALITLTRIIGPSLWAGVADARGNPLRVMQFGSLLTVLVFSGVLFAQGFVWLTLVFALMMMFWTAILPQLEVITLQHLKSSTVTYGKIRLWGSIGFILLAVITGQAIDIFGSETPIYASMIVLTLLFIATLVLRPVNHIKHDASQEGAWKRALQKPFIVFIISALLLQMSFGAFYGFFALYLRDLGYTGTQTGLLIALGVVAEVIIFLCASRIIKRLGVRLTLIICLAVTALRWWALGFLAEFAVVVILSQLIHALSFGLTHATSVHFIHHFFPSRFQSRGQAIYISLAFGVGGAVGHYVSGLLWLEGAGSATAFGAAGVMSLIGALVLMLVSKQSMELKSASTTSA